MHTLKKVIGVVTFAALSLSGPAAWAADSFVTNARLNGDKVVPSVLSAFTGELCLIISEPETSSKAIGQILAPARPSRPGGSLKPPGNRASEDVVENVRLYFGQRFANGQPILTLCDDDFKEDGCHIHFDEETELFFICTNPFTPGIQCDHLDFDLNSVQFQSEQRGIDERQVDLDGRLHDIACDPIGDPEQCGFLVIKDLIQRGLIYVVFNSDFKAKLRKDGTIRYEPPKGRLAVDGLLRGTLSLVKKCPPLPP